MNKTIIFCLQSIILILLIVSSLEAQVVKTIKIIGNTHTKDYIIKREILHPMSSQLDSSLLFQDRNRIYNLGIFSTVEIFIENSVYNVSVVETFRFIPFPLINYDEGEGISYGGGIAYKNFRGLNQKLSLGILFGQENTWFVNFLDPWITGDHISMNFSFYDYQKQGSVYAYKHRELGGKIGLGFYVGYQHKYHFNIGIEDIFMDTVNINNNNRWSLNNINFLSKYNYLFTSVKYQFDTRDVFIDPTKGHHLTFYLKIKLGKEETESHTILDMNHIVFKEISQSYGSPVISLRSSLFFQKSDDLPLFSKIYIGGEDFVRGYSPIPWQNGKNLERKIEGINAIYESIQLQHTLLMRKDWGGIELGVDAVYFVDFGVAINNLNSIKFDNGIFGYGFGLRFFVSGAGVIGIDFGFNPNGILFIHPAS